ncbi:MAG TPA: hypothetical protein VKU19_39175 [Bryobacteraceae bacterium]|nr:hypothetical protein [Bryobacteraceae bacterium]
MIVIMVTDNRGLSTFVVTGALPRGSGIEPTKATQLQGWLARPEIYRALRQLNRSPDVPGIWISRKSVRKAKPFAVAEGECSFEKSGNLCFYLGARNKSSDNVLMVLSNFPPALATRKYGTGKINSGGGAELVSGPVEWDLVAVNSPIEERVGDLDKVVGKAPPQGSKSSF